jgi:hypothetical protein
MNNIVLQYAREEYKYNIPKLLFDLDSQDEINVTIGAGMEKEVSFHATNSAKTMFSGVVVSESLFVDVLTPEFSGENNEIKLKIDSTAYSENSTFKGVVRVFTECGNANIRVNVDVDDDTYNDYYSIDHQYPSSIIAKASENGKLTIILEQAIIQDVNISFTITMDVDAVERAVPVDDLSPKDQSNIVSYVDSTLSLANIL